MTQINIEREKLLTSRGSKAKLLIDPNHRLKRYWDNLLTFLIVYVILILPVKFSFVEESYMIWEVSDYVIDLIFLSDILLTFITGYIDDNEHYVSSYKKIAKRYLKFWFWIDISSILPLHLIISTGNYAIFLRASKLPRLYKIAKISKVIRSVKTVRNQNTVWSSLQELMIRHPGVNRIFLNLFGIFIVCHLFACLWHYIARTDPSMDNWLVQS